MSPFDFLFSAKSSANVRSPKRRSLHFESLENRELLSVNPFAPPVGDNVPAMIAAAPAPVPKAAAVPAVTALKASTTQQSGSGLGQITLSWTAPKITEQLTLLNYKVEATYKIGKATATLNFGTVAAEATGKVFDNLPAVNTSYTFKVSAVYLTNEDAVKISSAVTATGKTLAFTAPSGFAVPSIGSGKTALKEVGVNQVNLKWNVHPLATDGFVLEVLQGKNTVKTVKLDGGTTSYTVAGLESGKAYTFKLTAKNGELTSAAAQVSATTATAPKVAGLKASTTQQSGSGLGQVKLTWTAPKIAEQLNATLLNYKVVATYKIGKATATLDLGTVAAREVGKVFDNLPAANTSYTFNVSAVYLANGVEITSAAVSVAGKTIAFTAPSGFTVPALGSGKTALKEIGVNQVNLKWNAHPDATDGFVLEVLQGKNTVKTVKLDGRATSYTVIGLESGKAYTFKLTAKNGELTSAAAQVSATTAAAPKVAGLKASTAQQNGSGVEHVSLTWTAPKIAEQLNATLLNYKVEATYKIGKATATLNLGTVAAGATGKVFDNLPAANTSYTFIVSAVYLANGVEITSAAVSVVGKTIAFTAPTGFAVSTIGSGKTAQKEIGTNQVKLKWNAHPDAADGFILEILQGKNTVKTVKLDGRATSYTVIGLDSSTAYTFKLTAKNGELTSAAAQVSATTQKFVGNLKVPAYSSLPASTYTIFLDFNGDDTITTLAKDRTRGPQAFDLDGDSTTFSELELKAIHDAWAVVAEYYSPFNVNVTTVDPGVDGLARKNSADNTYGVRVSFGAVSGSAAAIGMAWVNTFDDTASGSQYGTRGSGLGTDALVDAYAVYVSNKNNWKTFITGLAQCITHEAGHNLGLEHHGDSYSNYYYGHRVSSGTYWNAIMGVDYYRSNQILQWSRGDYNGADNGGQYDLEIITSNGFGYRADEVNTELVFSNSSAEVRGIIAQSNDYDDYTFTVDTAANYLFDIKAGVTIDSKQFSSLYFFADLYAGETLLSHNLASISALTASISQYLGAGEYTLRIGGTGFQEGTYQGFSSYGSVGTYTINGSKS